MGAADTVPGVSGGTVALILGHYRRLVTAISHFDRTLLSLLARGRYTVPGRAFPEWKSPEWLVWILITAGFLVAFVEGIAGTFALNLLVILLPVYFLQGLAVIDCFFRRKAFSPIIRTVGYLLVTLVNPLPMVVTGIGVFDLWADFRKPKEPES